MKLTINSGDFCGYSTPRHSEPPHGHLQLPAATCDHPACERHVRYVREPRFYDHEAQMNGDKYRS